MHYLFLKKVGFIGILGFTATFCAAQAPADDFNRVNRTYAALKGFSVNMEYIIYKGHDGTQAGTVQSGSFKTDMRNRYLFKVGDVIRLHNERYDIMISEEDKAMAVQTTPSDKSVPLFGIDTIGMVWRKAIKIGEGNGFRTWRVKFDSRNGEFEKMDITLDIETFLVKSISLYYRLKMGRYLNSEDTADDYLPKLTINYKQVVLNPTFSTEDFSEKKYIRVTDAGIISTGTYQNYELIIRNP